MEKNKKSDEYLRSETEKNLNFVGLIFFENPLKPETIPTMKILNEAELNSIIVTGDNVLTATEVGKKSHFIKENQ